MRVSKRLWSGAALIGLACTALSLPAASNAQLIKGLSLRAGFYHPASGTVRSVTDFFVWGGGLQYEVPWVPHVFNGEHWTSSISADFHYSERKAGIVRYFPVTINQVYTFEEQNGHSPYAGFSIGAATFGSTGTGPGGVGGQATVTRLMGGLILGVNLTHSLYLEGRYEWVDQYKVAPLEGFRGYVGWRF